MTTLNFKNYSLTFNNDSETCQKLFDELLGYYLKYEEFTSDQILKSDSFNAETDILLSNIAENIFRFEVKRKK